MRVLVLPVCARPRPTVNGDGFDPPRVVRMIALGVMAFLGCNDQVAGPDALPGPVDEPGQRVGAIVLQLEADTLWVNETAQLLVTVLGTDGDTLTDAAVTFTSSNEHILNVSSTGLVTAVGSGTAAVTARSEDSSATARLFAAVAAMALVSGESQTGDIGKPLSKPFVLRVTDAQGVGVAGVRVVWSVNSGEGDFLPFNGTTEAVTFTSTDDDGLTRAQFTPLALGSIRVLAAADIDGVKGSPVTFMIDGALFLSDLPPFSGSSLIYDRVGTDSNGLVSSYILYEDRTFEVHYSNGVDFPGKYSIREKVISFDFDGSSWLATGTLRGDSLSVKYNLEAAIDGFEDGVYIRSAGT